MMKRRLTSMLLALVMCLGLCVPAFATPAVEIPSATILQDNVQYRVAETVYAGARYVSTYDKINHTLTMARYSVATGIKEIEVVGDLDQNTMIVSDGEGRVVNALLDVQAESLYGYVVYSESPLRWTLSRPQYDGSTRKFSFMCQERASNKEDLKEYQAAVENLVTAEIYLEALVDNFHMTNIMTLVMATVGFVSPTAGPSAFGAALTSAMAGYGQKPDIEKAIAQIVNHQHNAILAYERVRRDWIGDLRLRPDTML